MKSFLSFFLGIVAAMGILYVVQNPSSVISYINQNIPTVRSVSAAENPNISRNWAGYVATNGTFTGISGTWTVPSFNLTSSNYGADATWVGIGGVSSSDLIQVGTQESVGPNGRITYEAWYETLPQVSRPLQITISPGDSVTGSLTQTSSGQWQVSLKDNTNGQSLSFPVSYTSSLSSADWIEEAPSGMRSVLPLDNFGSVSFSNATTIKNGSTVSISQANAQAVSMAGNGRQLLASASTIGNDGSSFSVSRTSSQIPESEVAANYSQTPAQIRVVRVIHVRRGFFRRREFPF